MNKQRINKWLSNIFFVFSLVAACNLAAEQHHTESKSFSINEFKPGFYFLQGMGGNILVSKGNDGVLLVDSDYKEMTQALEKALKDIGGELKFVLNTHWHGDHTQGNLKLGHQAHIVAHDNVYERLNSRQEIKLFKMVSAPYPEHALPMLTFDRSLTLHFNGHTVKALHYPHGHTDGDSIIFFKEANVVHMGDHYFNGIFPFVDVDSKGDVKGLAANVEKALKFIDNNTVVIPGHGALSNKKELIAFKEMVEGTAAEVEAMMKKNISLEQIQAKGLSKKWEDWGKGFLNEKTWIKIVHASLSK